jgi:hypothetical protein
VDDKSMTLFWTEPKDRTHRGESEMMVERGGIGIKLDDEAALPWSLGVKNGLQVNLRESIFVLTMNKSSYTTPLGAEISPSMYASELADKCSSPKICTVGLPILKTRQLACRFPNARINHQSPR